MPNQPIWLHMLHVEVAFVEFSKIFLVRYRQTSPGMENTYWFLRSVLQLQLLQFFNLLQKAKVCYYCTCSESPTISKTARTPFFYSYQPLVLALLLPPALLQHFNVLLQFIECLYFLLSILCKVDHSAQVAPQSSWVWLVDILSSIAKLSLASDVNRRYVDLHWKKAVKCEAQTSFALDSPGS